MFHALSPALNSTLDLHSDCYPARRQRPCSYIAPQDLAHTPPDYVLNMSDYSSIPPSSGPPRSPLFGTATFSTLSATQTPMSPSRLSSTVRSGAFASSFVAFRADIVHSHPNYVVVRQRRRLVGAADASYCCITFTNFKRFRFVHVRGRRLHARCCRSGGRTCTNQRRYRRLPV